MFLMPRCSRVSRTYGLLLVLGEYERERQVVYIAIEGSGQCDGNPDGGIGSVALADVEQARNAADVAKIELVEAELPAGQREDRAIFRDRFGKVGALVAAGLGVVDGLDAGPLDETGGDDAGRIVFFGFWMQWVVMRIAPGKGFEFSALILPCAAIITDDVRVFLQLRIAAAGSASGTG